MYFIFGEDRIIKHQSGKSPDFQNKSFIVFLDSFKLKE